MHFFTETLLASTHDTIRELHHHLSVVLDEVREAMTHSDDDAIPAEIATQLTFVANTVFKSSFRSVNSVFINTYGADFFNDFVQGLPSSVPNSVRTNSRFPRSLTELHSSLLKWKKMLTRIIISSSSFDLPDPMLRTLNLSLNDVSIPMLSSLHFTRIRPQRVLSVAPSLRDPSYQFRCFSVLDESNKSHRFVLRSLPSDQLVCVLHAITVQNCLQSAITMLPLLKEEGVFSSVMSVLPVGSDHALVREKSSVLSLFNLVDAILREKGSGYDDVMQSAVPMYVDHFQGIQHTLPNYIDFESLLHFL